MDTETGRIYDSRTEREEMDAALALGALLVPVSEQVARVQRIGQSRLRQQRKRQRQARRKARK